MLRKHTTVSLNLCLQHFNSIYMSIVVIPLCNNGYYLWRTFYVLCYYELIIIIFLLCEKQKQKNEA